MAGSDLPLFSLNKQVFVNQTMGATQTSAIIDLAETLGYAVHSIWTGSPVGNISTQGSNDGVHFVEVDTEATGGVAGQHLLNVEKHHYRYVIIVYQFTSGAGTLNCYVSGKRG